MSDSYLHTEFDTATAPLRYRQILTPILRLLPFIRAFKGLFTITLATMVAYHLSALAVSATSAWIITRLVATGQNGSDVIRLFGYLAAAILGAGVFMWLNSWYAHLLSYRIIATLRIHVYDAIARINPAGLQKRRTGDVATASMADLEATEWFYAHTVADVIAACITSLVLTVPLTLTLGPSGILPLLGAWLILALPLVTLPVQMRQGIQLRQSLSTLKSSSLEGLQGLRDIVCLGLTEHFVGDIQGHTDKVQRAARRYTIRSGIEKSVEDIITTAVTIGMLIIMLQQYSTGRLDAAVIPIVLVGVTTVLRVVISVAGMLRKLGEISAASARFLLLHDAPATVEDPPHPVPLPGGQLGLSFRNVHFAYPGGRPVLNGVDLEVPAGRTVALVGQSGSGKSTLASLLVRLWDVDEGAILVGGRDVRDVSREDLRSCVTLVSQQPYVFSGTLRHNLCLGAPDADDEQLWAALEAAQLRTVVEELEGGLDAELGERAVNLSGGQKQRLNLAQAFLRDSPVVVMDEAVSHLDPELERELNLVTSKLRQNRTTLIIAHRLSTIERADLVALLDNGVISQIGSHGDLVARNPRYVEILANQLKPPGDKPADTSKSGKEV